MTSIEALRETLLRGSHRFKTGFILVDDLDAWKLDPISLQLHAFQVDYHKLRSQRISPDSRVLPYDEKDLINELREIARVASTHPVAMVLNLDLALAKLSSEAISRFWFNFSTLDAFSPTAVVLVVPTKSLEIQPVGQEYEQWKEWGKMVTVEA